MTKKTRLAWLCVVLTAACGSRTALFTDVTGGDVDDGDGGLRPDGAPLGDAGPDANIIVETDASCVTAAECNDGIPCTLDTCQGGRCFRELADSLCDDGVFCNGVERCDVTAGCVERAQACDDGIACSLDACDEAARGCRHTPDDTLCPPSHVCDLALSCQARVLAHDTENLYDVRVPSGVTTLVGRLGTTLTDVALTPGNRLFGISYDALFDVDTATGATRRRSTLPSGTYNAFDLAPDGTLYIGGGRRISSLDVATGRLTAFANVPSPTSGDIAFVGNRMLVTVTGPADDELVEIDLVTRVSRRLGSIGYPCVWGLAAYGPTLYGFSCDGYILGIDTGTGAGSIVTQTNVTFYGATAR